MSITWPAPSAPELPASIPVPGLPVPRGRTAAIAAAAAAAGVLAVAGALSLQRELRPAPADGAVTPFGALHAVRVAPARPIARVNEPRAAAVLQRVRCAGAKGPVATTCFTAIR
jgi:hypothetical protein